MQKHHQHGTVLVELACSAVLLVIMAIFCFDASIMIYANSILDEATRDAARCAALTGSAARAQQAAQVAFQRHTVVVPFLRNLRLSAPVLYVTAFSPPYDQIADPSGGPGTVPSVPYVEIYSAIDANIPAPLAVFGQVFGSGNLTFNDLASFPLLNNPDNLPLGSFDQQMPVWTGAPPSNYYPCINPKACPPLGTPCVIPAPPPAGPPPPPPPPSPPAPPIPPPPAG